MLEDDRPGAAACALGLERTRDCNRCRHQRLNSFNRGQGRLECGVLGRDLAQRIEEELCIKNKSDQRTQAQCLMEHLAPAYPKDYRNRNRAERLDTRIEAGVVDVRGTLDLAVLLFSRSNSRRLSCSWAKS